MAEFISISTKKPKGKSVKKIKKQDKTKPKVSNKIKLFFQERCPDASEVRKIHPKIQDVFVPKRPASIRSLINRSCSLARLYCFFIELITGIFLSSDIVSLNSIQLRHLKRSVLHYIENVWNHTEEF